MELPISERVLNLLEGVKKKGSILGIDWESSSDVKKLSGTGYIGKIKVSYDKLVKTFGEPEPGDSKTSANWYIYFKNGAKASIYDWGFQKQPVEKIDNWHIGGNREGAKFVAKILGVTLNK